LQGRKMGRFLGTLAQLQRRLESHIRAGFAIPT
jgi:hypothetical protein